MKIEKYERFRILAAIFLLFLANARAFQVYLLGFKWDDFLRQMYKLLYGIIDPIIIQLIYIIFYGIMGFLLIFLKKNKFLTFICVIVAFVNGTRGFLHFMNEILLFQTSIDWFNMAYFLTEFAIVTACVYYYIRYTRMDIKERLTFVYVNIIFIILVVIITIFYILIVPIFL